MRSPLLRALLPLLILACTHSSASAQAALVVEHDKKGKVVVAARGSRPYFEENGKLVAANGERYALLKVDEFLPVFISVRDVKAGTYHIELMGSGASLNNEFRFKGSFESSYPLDEVFLVVELFMDDGSKSLFLREIGHLERDHPRTLDLALPVSFPIGRFKYRYHLYVHGMEALHSELPFAMREAALDRLIAKRNKGRADGPPQPFIGPPPLYPKKLLKAKTSGSATLKLLVRSTGAVVDASVLTATDPAFGESALEAMRQWRFLPRLKDGRPVDTSVEMPIKFDPPGAASKS